MTLSDKIGCLFALLRFRKSRRLARGAQAACKNDIITKFDPASVSIRQLIVCSFLLYTHTEICFIIGASG